MEKKGDLDECYKLVSQEGIFNEAMNEKFACCICNREVETLVAGLCEDCEYILETVLEPSCMSKVDRLKRVKMLFKQAGIILAVKL